MFSSICICIPPVIKYTGLYQCFGGTFMEVIASRDFNQLFIYLDIFFLVGLSALLFYSRRYMTIIFGLLGGIIYFLVDYGIFYKLLGTRVINGAQPFVFLLWLSMSYGFTNFAWIWLFLNRDKRFWEWSTFIVAGWLAVALLSQNFGSGFQQISISRGTSSYHGFMALVLFAGYAFLVILNIRNEKRGGEGYRLLARDLGINVGIQP